MRTDHHWYIYGGVQVWRKSDVVFGIEVPVLFRCVPRYVRLVETDGLHNFIISFI